MTAMSETVAIVGSRDYPDLEQVREYVRSLQKDTVIVTGGWWEGGNIIATRGVDTTAAQEGRALGMNVALVAGSPAHGKYAGWKRNPAVVNIADRVAAFQFKDSPGTAGTIKIARNANKPLEIFEPRGQAEEGK